MFNQDSTPLHDSTPPFSTCQEKTENNSEKKNLKREKLLRYV